MYRLNYGIVTKSHQIVLSYCLKYSDSFSVITNLKKPYSKKPPNLEHDDFFSAWSDCLIEQMIGVKEWPGTQTRDNHKVLNLYSTRKFRKKALPLPNFFLPTEKKLPEDICFYRDGHVWFVTISHEKIVFLTSYTDRDLDFFKDMM